MNSILCMLPQPHDPQPPAGPIELNKNVCNPEFDSPLRAEPKSQNPIITVVPNRPDSRIRAENSESELGRRSEGGKDRSDTLSWY